MNNNLISPISVFQVANPYGVIQLKNGDCYKITLNQAAHLQGSFQNVPPENVDPVELQKIYDEATSFLNAHLETTGQKDLGDYFTLTSSHTPGSYEEEGYRFHVPLPLPWKNEQGSFITYLPVWRIYPTAKMQHLVYSANGRGGHPKVIGSSSPELQTLHAQKLAKQLHRLIELAVTPHTKKR